MFIECHNNTKYEIPIKGLLSGVQGDPETILWPQDDLCTQRNFFNPKGRPVKNNWKGQAYFGKQTDHYIYVEIRT